MSSLRISQGIDPALGEDSRAAYFAIATVGMEWPVQRGSPRLHVLDIVRVQKVEAPDQPALVIEAWDKWTPSRVAVESIFYQTSLIQYLRRDRPDIRWEPIVPKGDKSVRLEALAYHYKHGHIFHPPHGPTEPRWLSPLEDELTGIGWFAGKKLHKHDDQGDALYLAATALLLTSHTQPQQSVVYHQFTVDAGPWI